MLCHRSRSTSIEQRPFTSTLGRALAVLAANRIVNPMAAKARRILSPSGLSRLADVPALEAWYHNCRENRQSGAFVKLFLSTLVAMLVAGMALADPYQDCANHLPYGVPSLSATVDATPICRSGYIAFVDNAALV